MAVLRNSKSKSPNKDKTRKSDRNKIKKKAEGEKESSVDLGVPDLTKSLPFKHCRIVLSYEEDEEKAGSEWRKEENDNFVFYETMAAPEKRYLSHHLKRISNSKSDNTQTDGYRPGPKSKKIKKEVIVSHSEGVDETINKLKKQKDEEVQINLPKTFGSSEKKVDSDKKKSPISNKGNNSPMIKVVIQGQENLLKSDKYEDPGFTCPYCLKSFEEGKNLIDHLKDHAGFKPKVKENSNASTTVKGNETKMEVHDKKGTNSKCSHCPRYFKTSFALHIHTRLVHKKGSGKTKEDKDTNIPGNILAVRNGTGSKRKLPSNENNKEKHAKVMLTPSLLEDAGLRSITGHHELQTKAGSSKPIIINPLKHQKLQPNYEANETFEVTANIEKFDKKYKCRICDQLFSCRRSTWRHIKRIHNREKKFSCTKCPKSFYEIKDLQVHLHRHEGIRPYQCDNCEKAYFNRKDLVQHKLIHSDNKSFKCKQCNKSFYTPTNLRRHSKIHDRIRSCKCSTEYFTKSDLKKHYMSVHAEKLFKCAVCDREYFRNGDLRRHVRKSHGGAT